MRTLVALLLCLLLGCGVDRELPPLLIWVPGGGAPAARVRELVSEMGLYATVLTDRELCALRPSALRGVRVAVCFDGRGGDILSSSLLAALPSHGGALLVAGEAAASLGPAWEFKARATDDPVLCWEPRVWPRLEPGTFDPQGGAALTYSYGLKILSGWRLEAKEGDVWARDRHGRPRWLERQAPGGGRLVVAGLPLAAEASLGDSCQARLFLERAAELARLPRLWPTPEGKGAVLVNVHVDSKAHIAYLQDLLKRWPPQLRGTFHFTAGPDCDQEGDGQGFNVADPNLGGAWVSRLAALGEVGPHGGWIHNLWASQGPHLSLAARQGLLARNFDALAPWGASKTYSSPGGYHPADLNPWLEAHGVRGYYHTGEGGNPPTHAWLNGVPFAQTMWAFPVATLGAEASTYEFKHKGVAESQVAAWFTAVSAFCATRRETRMVYGHSIDFADMPLAYGGLLDTLGEALKADRLRSWTLADYAAFLDRRQQVRWSVSVHGQELVLRARGALQGMAFQVPGAWREQADPGLVFNQADGATWIVIKNPRQTLELHLWPS